jgi:hypothetical protein
MQNDIGSTSEVEGGDNSKLIEALKKQDEAKKQVELLKKQKSSGNNLNSNTNM